MIIGTYAKELNSMYRIGEIARKAGVSRRTIDYYTNMNLLKPVRLDNNYRYYSEEDFLRLREIEQMKGKRYSLEEIRDRLEKVGDLKFSANETGRFYSGLMVKKNNTKYDFIQELHQEKKSFLLQEKPDLDYLQRQLHNLEQQLLKMQNLTEEEGKQQKVALKQTISATVALVQGLAMYIQ